MIRTKHSENHLQKLTIMGINQKLKYCDEHIILLAWNIDIP